MAFFDQIQQQQMTPQMLQMLMMMRNGMTTSPAMANMGAGTAGPQNPGPAPAPQVGAQPGGAAPQMPSAPQGNQSALSSPLGGMMAGGLPGLASSLIPSLGGSGGLAGLLGKATGVPDMLGGMMGGGQGGLGQLMQLLQMLKGQNGGTPTPGGA